MINFDRFWRVGYLYHEVRLGRVNDLVVWLHEPQGGYGYIYSVNAKITRIALKKTQIEVVKKNGEKVCRWVFPEKLKVVF